jgi:hypothetical protein
LIQPDFDYEDEAVPVSSRGVIRGSTLNFFVTVAAQNPNQRSKAIRMDTDRRERERVTGAQLTQPSGYIRLACDANPM